MSFVVKSVKKAVKAVGQAVGLIDRPKPPPAPPPPAPVAVSAPPPPAPVAVSAPAAPAPEPVAARQQEVIEQEAVEIERKDRAQRAVRGNRLQFSETGSFGVGRRRFGGLLNLIRTLGR